MIISFGDKAASDLFHGASSRHVRKLPNQILEAALYKLDVLNAAQDLDDLRSPPGNRLEPLKGDFKGFQFALIHNGELCSVGMSMLLTKSKLWTITNIDKVTYDSFK